MVKIKQLNRTLEQELAAKLTTAHKSVVIGGHYPLAYDDGSVVEGIEDGKFGAFPEYTMMLAAKIVATARAAGADASIAVLVDDTSQMIERDWYLQNPLPAYAADIEQYFIQCKIPTPYLNILNQHGLSPEAILPAKDALLFQETKYRSAFAKKYGAPPSCAGELGMILRELQAGGVTNVLGLIPAVCEGPSCTAAQYTLRDMELNLTMAYLPTGEHVDELYLDRYLHDPGVTVREYS